jgi:hypothetical protein
LQLQLLLFGFFFLFFFVSGSTFSTMFSSTLSLLTALLLLVAPSSAGPANSVVLRVSKHSDHWSEQQQQQKQLSAAAADDDPNANTSAVADVALRFNSVVEAHFAELRFGDSLAPVRLLIDTGSPDTLVVTNTINPHLYNSSPKPRSFADYEKMCYSDGSDAQLTLSATGRNISCGEVAARNASWCQNERAANFTCGDSACTLFEWYGDGSGRVGALVNDLVTITEPPVPLYFVRALRLSSGRLSEAVDTALAGILGLSPTMHRGKLPTLLDQLHDAGVIARRMFGLCLPDVGLFTYNGPSESDGHLVLGAPHNLTTKGLADNVEFTTPLLMNTTFPDDNGTFVPRFLVQVQNVSIGLRSFNFSGLALVDSGTVQVVLPPALYDRIADFYVGMCDSTSLSWSTLCKTTDRGVSKIRAMFGFVDDDEGFVQYAIGGLVQSDLSRFQPITFDLGNGIVVLDWQHLFLRDQQRYGITLSRGEEDSQAIMLGNHLMRAYRTVFDVDNALLTWAQPNLCADAPVYVTDTLPVTDPYPWWQTTTAFEDDDTSVATPVENSWWVAPSAVPDYDSPIVHVGYWPPWLILASALGSAFVLVVIVLIVVTVCRRRREAQQRSQTYFVRI